VGLDFIRKAKPEIRKGWSMGREELSCPGLFTKEPDSDRGRTVLFVQEPGQVVAVGHTFVLSVDGDKLLARDGIPVVASALRAPADLLGAIRAASNSAVGRVTAVHPESRVVDVEIE